MTQIKILQRFCKHNMFKQETIYFVILQISMVYSSNKLKKFNIYFLDENSQLIAKTHRESAPTVIKDTKRIVLDLGRYAFIEKGMISNYEKTDLHVVGRQLQNRVYNNDSCITTWPSNMEAEFSCNGTYRYVVLEGFFRIASIDINGYYTFHEMFLGCFIVQHRSGNISDCFEHCKKQNSTFFGIRQARRREHCLCLDSLKNVTETKLDSCSYPCRNFPKRMCGGLRNSYSIYTTEKIWGKPAQPGCVYGMKDCPQCPPGRVGLNCDIADCSTKTGNCGDELCVTANPIGTEQISFCSCRTGYKYSFAIGKFVCEDIDECESKPCGDGASDCHNTLGTFSCTCLTGYQSLDGPVCKDIDECFNQMCDLISTLCWNQPGSFKCTCKDGFSADGPTSCKDIDECLQNKCDAASTKCSNVIGTFKCVCLSGFEQKSFTTCGDIDECANEVCDSATTYCVNQLGSFSCECVRGYVKDDHQICQDINECSGSNPCETVSTYCNNMPGSFTCDCNRGFIRENSLRCKDIDECQYLLHNCGKYSTCSNTIGSYTCTCPPGTQSFTYEHLNECEDIDECKDHHECNLTVSVCLNVIMSYICQCIGGYVNENNFSCILVQSSKSTTTWNYEDEDFSTRDYDIVTKDSDDSITEMLFVVPFFFFLFLGIITSCYMWTRQPDKYRISTHSDTSRNVRTSVFYTL